LIARVQAAIFSSPLEFAHVAASSAIAVDTKPYPATTRSAAIPTSTATRMSSPHSLQNQNTVGSLEHASAAAITMTDARLPARRST
jgi:hypothetical protein